MCVLFQLLFVGLGALDDGSEFHHEDNKRGEMDVGFNADKSDRFP